MITRALIAFAVLAAGLAGQEPLKFMGRDVTVVDPGTVGSNGSIPKGPATVCLEGTPRQCYTMPEKFGGDPEVDVVETKRDQSALLFSAHDAVGSGTTIHLALLQPGPGGSIIDLFPNISISNLGQHAFWEEPSISDAKIFVTADFEWGQDEAHYDPHRYIISSYLLLTSSLSGDQMYWLQDRYMTVRKYDALFSASDADVLASERLEILRRLVQVKIAPRDLN